VGLGGAAVTALIWFFAGPGFQVDVNFWKMGGNVFSNFYEEFCYRVLLFGAGLYCFRSFWPAALISGLAFGLTHTQYPFVFRLFTAGVGYVAALAYFKSRSVLAPWLAHQLSDMLLDTFLKT
jgi:membrane protease YdiL (CAAX protease family)